MSELVCEKPLEGIVARSTGARNGAEQCHVLVANLAGPEWLIAQEKQNSLRNGLQRGTLIRHDLARRHLQNARITLRACWIG